MAAKPQQRRQAKAATMSKHGKTAQRLPEVIQQNKDVIAERWLEAVEQDAEIGSILLPHFERKERLIQLLAIATTVAEGKELSDQDRHACLRYGAMRFQQSYTVPLLMREAKLLQTSLADYMQRNFAAVDLIHLVPDIVRLMSTIETLWKTAARGFVQQEHAEKVANRRKVKRIIGDAKAS
jgi:hypothetical protein